MKTYGIICFFVLCVFCILNIVNAITHHDSNRRYSQFVACILNLGILIYVLQTITN